MLNLRRSQKKEKHVEVADTADFEDSVAQQVLIADGALLVATEEATVFSSCESAAEIRIVKVNEEVIASGPAREVDGYVMVPIRPRGAVQACSFSVLACKDDSLAVASPLRIRKRHWPEEALTSAASPRACASPGPAYKAARLRKARDASPNTAAAALSGA